MVIGIYVGIVTGAWIYAIIKVVYEDCGCKGKKVSLQLPVATGVINSWFNALLVTNGFSQ